MEASGTGNMKFALNGALTIGTLDGANIEIREAVGHDNLFLFGLTAEEVAQVKRSGYDPQRVYYSEAPVRAALDAVRDGVFSPEAPQRFQGVVRPLIEHDPYFVLADFLSYTECQRVVETAYRDSADWARRAILNVANMGEFSSDRTILGYSREIWGTHPEPGLAAE
jgi:starch phosphorylase